MAYRQREALVGWFSRATTSAVTAESVDAMNPKRVETRLAEAEKRIPAIIEQIETGKYQAARELYDQLFGRLERLRAANSDPMLPRGRPLSAEIARNQRHLSEQITGILLREIESARTSPDNLVIPPLLERFPRIGDHDIRAVYAAEAPALDRARRLRASRWIRVEAIGEPAEFSDTLEALVARIHAPPGYAVVRGHAAGPLEEAATFCKLVVEVRPRIQNYVKVVTRSVGAEALYDYSTAKGLLAELVVTLRLHPRSRDYPTSWTALSESALTLRLELETPPELNLPRDSLFEEFFLELNRERVVALRSELPSRFAALPALDFSPETHPAPLSRAQALSVPADFSAALRGAQEKKTDPAGAWLIVAELALEDLAPALQKRLPTLTPSEQSAIARALAAHPWFGTYQPLLQLVESGSPDAFLAAIRALGAEQGEPAIMRAILDRFRKERFAPSLKTHLNAVAATRSAAEAPALLALYPELPQGMRAAFLSGLMTSRREAAGRLALERIATASAPEILEIATALESSLGRLYSGLPLELTADEQQFFSAAAAKLGGENRVTLLKNLPRSPTLWRALIASPRGAWTPAENLALLQHTQSLAAADEKLAAIRELCQFFASGALSNRALQLQADNVLGNLSNSLLGARRHQPGHAPLLVWLLDQPEKSPHADVFGRTASHLIAGVMMPELLAEPQARALLESARRHANAHVRGRAAELIKAAAEKDPAYRDLLQARPGA